MAVVITCSGCARKLRVGEEILGRTVRCPACQATFKATAETPVLAAVVPALPVPPMPPMPDPLARPGPPPSTTYFDDEDLRPPFGDRPRRRKRSQTPLIVGFVLLGLFLVGGLTAGVIMVVKEAVKNADGKLSKEWKEFHSAGGNFSVMMPGVPKDETLNMLGVSVKKNMLIGKDQTLFVIGYFDIAPAQMRPGLFQDVYVSERDNMKQTTLGTVVEERDVKLGPHKGREFTIQTGNHGGILISRIFHVQDGKMNRIFIVDIGGPKITAKSAAAVEFFGSFKVGQDAER